MKILLIIVSCLAALAAVPSAFAQPTFTPEETRQLIEQYTRAKVRYEAMRERAEESDEKLRAAQRENHILREALIRKGVDVEELLTPKPTTQTAVTISDIIFESPEAVAGYIRHHFSKRIRSDMTRLQLDAARKDFGRWLDSANLLGNQVTWVVRIDDVWKLPDKPDETERLAYAQDREAVVSRLVTLHRTMTGLEMLELQVHRLKTRQKDLRSVYDERIRQMQRAPAGQKRFAEARMRIAYEDWVKVNTKLRTAEQQYQVKRRLYRRSGSTTQAVDQGYSIMIRGIGGRDDKIALSIFCHEKSADRLMAAPGKALVKIRGWLMDVALAEEVASIGLRIDQAEVRAVNVENPPPPPVLPEEGGETPESETSPQAPDDE
jgi:hypothetical protein